MRLSLPLLLSTLLLPFLSTASPTPTPTSLAPFIQTTISSIPIATPPPPPPKRRNNDLSIPPVSIPPVSIPPVSIPPVSIPPISIPSREPYTRIETCTPGYSAYATPGVDGYVPREACNALWVYFPNFAAAVAFSALFGVLTLVHIAQATVYRNGFCWVVIMAGLWETSAYAFRALGSKDQQSSGIALVAQILVLVAPVWVNAFAYMVFARMVHFYSPTRKVFYLSPSVLALIFVTLDIISFVVQLIGGGMAGPGSSLESQKKGLDIYMGGIGMQEGFVVLFLCLVVKFHRDQLQAERMSRLSADKTGGWKWLIGALYTCLLAITIRIVYRLAEFSAGLGPSNPLPSNEPLLYVLESAPMLLALIVWNIVHPGRFIKGPDAKMPRSWLSRHLCCCCHRRRCDDCRGKLGPDHHHHHHHHSVGDSRMEDHQEMLPVSTKKNKHRVSVAVASPVDPFLDTVSSNEEQLLRLRPSPDAGYHRDVSPEPSIYTAYRPR